MGLFSRLWRVIRGWLLLGVEKAEDPEIVLTEAKEAMVLATDTDHAPWTSIKSSDKKRARINAMRFFLNRFDYEDKDPAVVYPADPKIVQRARDQIKD